MTSSTISAMISPATKLFIVEYVGGGGMRQELVPPSLLAEGDAMLGALLHGFRQHDITLSYSRDDRLPPHPAHEDAAVMIHGCGNPLDQWRAHCHQYDALLPIAPETDGALLSCCTIAPESCRLWLSDKNSIAIASSKKRSYDHLATHLDMIPVYDLHELPSRPNDEGWVIKPDDGAGCLFNYHVSDSDCRAFRPPPDADAHTRWIATPFMTGDTLSLSLFYGEDRVSCLAVNRQHMVTDADGRMTLQTIDVAIGDDETRAKGAHLARMIEAVMPLTGMVGVDVIEQDGRWWVADINPRITTSIVDLPPDWARLYLT